MLRLVVLRSSIVRDDIGSWTEEIGNIDIDDVTA